VKPFADTVLSFVDQVNLYLNSAKEPGFVKWDAKNAVFAVWIGVNVSFPGTIANMFFGNRGMRATAVPRYTTDNVRAY